VFCCPRRFLIQRDRTRCQECVTICGGLVNFDRIFVTENSLFDENNIRSIIRNKMTFACFHSCILSFNNTSFVKTSFPLFGSYLVFRSNQMSEYFRSSEPARPFVRRNENPMNFVANNKTIMHDPN